jgi:amino acid transporter
MTIIRKPIPAEHRDLLRSERMAGGILPRVLNSFDMVVIAAAIILWIPNAGIITAARPVAYIYWFLGIILFLIPGALVSAQLGLMFPNEGSIYIWSTKAFGDFLGFLAGFCAWWSGILSMIAAADMVVTLIQYLGVLYGLKSFLSDSGTQGMIIIAILALSFIFSLLRFRVTQNIVNTTFFAYLGVILLVGAAALIWLLNGHTTQANFSWQSGQWDISGKNSAFYGTAILALLGIETPLNMGVEIRSTRAITRYLLWGTLLVGFAYLFVTSGVMVAGSKADQGSPLGMVGAIRQGFGPWGVVLATLADIALISFFTSIATVYNYSFGRLLLVSGLDRRLPAIVCKISSNKIPWVAILVQTILSIVLVALIFILVPIFSQIDSTVLPTVFVFDILEACMLVIWCISMIFLFANIVIIRRKYAELFARVQLAPTGVFFLCAFLGILSGSIGILAIFIAPWINENEVSTSTWNGWIICIILLSLLIAAGGFYLGKATVKSELSDEEIIQEITS